MTRSIALPTVRGSAALVLGAAVLLFATSGEVGRSGTTPTPCYAPLAYPGASASRAVLAQWMGAAASAAGLPPELPVMAALVDSSLRNRPARGTADSAGFFQMRVSIWNAGEYRGFPTRPQLQVKWFIDHAIAAKVQRLARGAGRAPRIRARGESGSRTWSALPNSSVVATSSASRRRATCSGRRLRDASLLRSGVVDQQRLRTRPSGYNVTHATKASGLDATSAWESAVLFSVRLCRSHL